MKRYATASAFAIVAMTGQAWADVTPEQVWSEFQEYMQSFGYEMTATEAMEGSTLTVSDITMTFPVPEEEGTAVRLEMPPLTYAEQGDGSVLVSYPEQSDVTVHLIEDDETAGEFVISLTQKDFGVTVSGSQGDMLYTYSAESILMELTRATAEGEEITRDMLSATATMGPLDGTTSMTQSDGLRRLEQDVTLGDLAYNLDFSNPDDSDENGTLTGQFSGLSSSGVTVLPVDMDYEDPTAMFRNGGSVDVVLKHAGGRNEFSLTESGGTTAGQFSSDGGEFGLAFSEEELTYAISGSGQTVALAGPEIPLPINAELGELGFALTMPLAASEEPQNASLSLVLGDFTMADMLWNIFDPGEVLPRDPATVAFNLDAEVTPNVSLLDSEAMEAMGTGDDLPGELNSLTLSDFVIDMVGAVITGEGAFTFDNSDLETFDGMPRPIGQIDLQASGLNGLLDNLISMGLMPEEDAMGFRMMMSMFTVPGNDPDTMTSTIEINEEGQILANGQRIQ